MADFDPYHEWLGISPEERPINHYSLLSLHCFESNTKVISNAADRQMAYVRTFQTGPHAVESQRILNELSKARVTLLNPKKKAAYDTQLRKEQSARTVPLPPPLPPLKRPEPVVYSTPKRPEPTVHSAAKRPEPEVGVYSLSDTYQSIKLDSKDLQTNYRNQSDLEDACRKIQKVYDQKNLLASMIEKSKTKLDGFQFGLSSLWYQLFPSEKYSALLRKLQRNLHRVKAFDRQFFLSISFFFKPPERERWNSLKDMIEKQRIEVTQSVWKIAEEYPVELYQGENDQYNVSNFKLKKCQTSVGHLDAFQSVKPYLFLGTEKEEGIYIYPSFVIIRNQDKSEIVPHCSLDLRISRVYLAKSRVPRGVKIIDSAWRCTSKGEERDPRHKYDEKKRVLEFFKLEIRTKSNQKLAFLFGSEDIADHFADILGQNVKMSFLPLEKQEEFNDLMEKLEFTNATDTSKITSDGCNGCCGCFFMVILIIIILSFL